MTEYPTLTVQRTEYATLTELMAGREPGSVKVTMVTWSPLCWFRPGQRREDGYWTGLLANGHYTGMPDTGPWLIVSEDAPKLDTLRLEIAAKVLAGMHASVLTHSDEWRRRHAYALAEADALLAEASRTKSDAEGAR